MAKYRRKKPDMTALLISAGIALAVVVIYNRDLGGFRTKLVDKVIPAS